MCGMPVSIDVDARCAKPRPQVRVELLDHGQPLDLRGELADALVRQRDVMNPSLRVDASGRASRTNWYVMPEVTMPRRIVAHLDAVDGGRPRRTRRSALQPLRRGPPAALTRYAGHHHPLRAASSRTASASASTRSPGSTRHLPWETRVVDADDHRHVAALGELERRRERTRAPPGCRKARSSGTCANAASCGCPARSASSACRDRRRRGSRGRR